MPTNFSAEGTEALGVPIDLDLLADFAQTRSVPCAVLSNDADLLRATGLDHRRASAAAIARVVSTDRLEGLRLQVAAYNERQFIVALPDATDEKATMVSTPDVLVSFSTHCKERVSREI